MGINLKDKIKNLSPIQKAKVEARAAELVAEEMTLRQLRKALKLTQVRVAKAQGISQDGVSCLEKRTDFLISTLRKTIEAMGGRLSLMVEFKGRTPVKLAGIAPNVSAETRPKQRTHLREVHT